MYLVIFLMLMFNTNYIQAMLQSEYSPTQLKTFDVTLSTHKKMIPIKRMFIKITITEPGNYSFYVKLHGNAKFLMLANTVQTISPEQIASTPSSSNSYTVTLETTANCSYVVIGEINKGSMIRGAVYRPNASEITPQWNQQYIQQIPESFSWSTMFTATVNKPGSYNLYLSHTTNSDMYNAPLFTPSILDAELLAKGNGSAICNWFLDAATITTYQNAVAIGELNNGALIRTSIINVSHLGRFPETFSADYLESMKKELHGAYVDMQTDTGDIIYHVPASRKGYYCTYVCTEQGYYKADSEVKMLGSSALNLTLFDVKVSKDLVFVPNIVLICQTENGFIRTPVLNTRFKQYVAEQIIKIVPEQLEWKDTLGTMVSNPGNFMMYGQLSSSNGSGVYLRMLPNSVVRVSSEMLKNYSGSMPLNFKFNPIFQNVVVVGELENGSFIRTSIKDVSTFGRFREVISMSEMAQIAEELKIEFDSDDALHKVHAKQTGYYQAYLLSDDDEGDNYHRVGTIAPLLLRGQEFNDLFYCIRMPRGFEGYMVVVCQTENKMVRSQELEIDFELQEDDQDNENGSPNTWRYLLNWNYWIRY